MIRFYEFKSVIHHTREAKTAYVELPQRVGGDFIKEGVAAKGTINGYPVRLPVLRLGSNRKALGISEEICRLIGKDPGGEVFITLHALDD